MAENGHVFLLSRFTLYSQEFFSVGCLGLFRHLRDIQLRFILVFPGSRQDSIMGHVRKRNGVDGNHRLIVLLVFLYQLQGTGFVAFTPIKGITQKQQDRLVVGKVYCLEYSMTESPLLLLIYVTKLFTYRKNTVFIFLHFWVQFVKVFFRQWRFKEIPVFQTFFF